MSSDEERKDVVDIIVEPGIDLKTMDANTDPLTIYCLPISGGGFVAQLGLLSELYEAKWIVAGRRFKGSKDYQPDLVLAASGGNVATYIAMAGDWASTGMMRNALKIEKSMFIRSWLPDHLHFIPTWVMGVVKGSVYREGYGAGYLFNSLFTPVTVQRTEVWTGTYDSNNKRAQFFCNLQKGKTLIRGDYFEDVSRLYGCMPLKWLAGDLDKIAVASMASASIPMLVCKQQLDGTGYADGGTMYASPATVMTAELYRLIMGDNPYHERLEQTLRDVLCGEDEKMHFTVHAKEGVAEIRREKRVTAKGDAVFDSPSFRTGRSSAMGQRAMRLIYFCSYEMDVPKGKAPAKGESARFSEALSQLIHSSVLQDRGACYDLLLRICGDESINIDYEHHPVLDKHKLADLLEELKKARHYVIFLYPHGSPSVNLQNFDATDTESGINKARSAYGAHVWYFPDPSSE